MPELPAQLHGIALVPLGLGLVVLLFGRRLYWLALGGLGFLLGLELAHGLLRLGSPAAETLIAVLAGVLGVVVAIAAQKLAVRIAGCLLGGYLTYWLLPTLALPLGRNETILAVCTGAVLGLLLAASLFDFALIATSAVVGALLISDALPLGAARAWAFLALLVVGVWVQSRRPPGTVPTR